MGSVPGLLCQPVYLTKYIAKLCLPTFQRQIALYSPCRLVGRLVVVTINSTSIKPSIKVRNQTYYSVCSLVWPRTEEQITGNIAPQHYGASKELGKSRFAKSA